MSCRILCGPSATLSANHRHEHGTAKGLSWAGDALLQETLCHQALYCARIKAACSGDLLGNPEWVGEQSPTDMHEAGRRHQ